MLLMISIIDAIIMKLHSVDTLARIGLISAVYLAVGFMLLVAVRVYHYMDSDLGFFGFLHISLHYGFSYLLVGFWPIILTGRIISLLVMIAESIGVGDVWQLTYRSVKLVSLPVFAFALWGSITLIMKIPATDVLVRILIGAVYLVFGVIIMVTDHFYELDEGYDPSFGRGFFIMVFWPLALFAVLLADGKNNSIKKTHERWRIEMATKKYLKK